MNDPLVKLLLRKWPHPQTRKWAVGLQRRNLCLSLSLAFLGLDLRSECRVKRYRWMAETRWALQACR